nr:hypothetical protein [Tanacetum cinerariifolium]
VFLIGAQNELGGPLSFAGSLQHQLFVVFQALQPALNVGHGIFFGLLGVQAGGGAQKGSAHLGRQLLAGVAGGLLALAGGFARGVVAGQAIHGVPRLAPRNDTAFERRYNAVSNQLINVGAGSSRSGFLGDGWAGLFHNKALFCSPFNISLKAPFFTH